MAVHARREALVALATSLTLLVACSSTQGRPATDNTPSPLSRGGEVQREAAPEAPKGAGREVPQEVGPAWPLSAPSPIAMPSTGRLGSTATLPVSTTSDGRATPRLEVRGVEARDAPDPFVTIEEVRPRGRRTVAEIPMDRPFGIVDIVFATEAIIVLITPVPPAGLTMPGIPAPTSVNPIQVPGLQRWITAVLSPADMSGRWPDIRWSTSKGGHLYAAAPLSKVVVIPPVPRASGAEPTLVRFTQTERLSQFPVFAVERTTHGGRMRYVTQIAYGHPQGAVPPGVFGSDPTDPHRFMYGLTRAKPARIAPEGRLGSPVPASSVRFGSSELLSGIWATGVTFSAGGRQGGSDVLSLVWTDVHGARQTVMWP